MGIFQGGWQENPESESKVESIFEYNLSCWR
jgi:hypothetical protein